MQPLISVDKLASSRDDFRVCDLRWDLTDPDKGRTTYESGHIPGAVFVDLDEELTGPPGDNGRHPLPEVANFAAFLGRLGIDPDTRVVAYDDVAGRIAARLWWMLRSIGHDHVQVLDGGYQAWARAGHGVDQGSVTPDPVTYPVSEGFSGAITRDQLAGRSLVDARAEERYRGDTEPIDPKAGHIPGAINIPTSHNLDEEGRFLPRDQLTQVYADLPTDTVVSCGSGVTACHAALAMAAAGLGMPEVYIGSFSEWSRLDLPVATGPNP